LRREDRFEVVERGWRRADPEQRDIRLAWGSVVREAPLSGGSSPVQLETQIWCLSV
jgi:hypothetical protein